MDFGNDNFGGGDAPTSVRQARAAAPLEPLDRRALHEAVAERVRDLITEGVLEPGARLNERVICDRLGVSRTPLREALKLLAGEGLVRLTPNRGAEVTRLSRDEIEHSFEVMGALEALAGELAAAHASAAEIAEVARLNETMRAAHAARDLPAYYRANQAIHAAIARAARNPVLAETHHRINTRIQALRFRSNLDALKWDAAMDEHDRMVRALAERDAATLGALMRLHLQHKRDIVLAQLDGSR